MIYKQALCACGGLTDYVYGTWAKCRNCGAWHAIQDADGRAVFNGPVRLPLSFHESSSRPHARGGEGGAQ